VDLGISIQLASLPRGDHVTTKRSTDSYLSYPGYYEVFDLMKVLESLVDSSVYHNFGLEGRRDFARRFCKAPLEDLSRKADNSSFVGLLVSLLINSIGRLRRVLT
jgi:hypothetical protein